MTQENSKSSGKFRRFLSGFKKDAERKTRGRPPLEPLSTSEIPAATDPLVQPRPDAPTPSTAVAPVGPIASDTQELERTVNSGAEEETLPANVALAKEVLNKAGKELGDKIPQDARGDMNFEIKASADIDTLADNIGSVLVTMMGDRQVEQSKQTYIQGLVKEWAKKTIPFVETGLTVANVYHGRGRMY